MKKLYLVFSLFILLKADAQTNEDADIKKVINNLFSNMQKFDTSTMRILFDPNARLQTALLNPKTNQTKLITESIYSFLVQIAKIKK